MLTLLVIFIAGIAGGLVGSLAGLGGGAVVVPVLALYAGIPLAYAAGASLISAIATSAGSASEYLKNSMANMRVGISLSIGTTLGAIVGSLIAAYIYSKGLDSVIFVLFGLVLLGSSYMEIRKLFGRKTARTAKPDWSTKLLGLTGNYYDEALKKRVHYSGSRWHFGLLVMFCAGMLSGLLGIGSGVLKVLGMDLIMGLPIKITTATSNFMIGVTTATSSGIYWANGLINPLVVAPAAAGVIIGAMAGSRIMPRLKGRSIRAVFIAVIVFLGVQMLLQGLGFHA